MSLRKLAVGSAFKLQRMYLAACANLTWRKSREEEGACIGPEGKRKWHSGLPGGEESSNTYFLP
jgi:hypothetical protein